MIASIIHHLGVAHDVNPTALDRDTLHDFHTFVHGALWDLVDHDHDE